MKDKFIPVYESDEMIFARQDRRRRIFEQYVLALFDADGADNLKNWNWEIIGNNVQVIISKADEFAEKEIKE
jgi:hypothetical protein